ncbi:MAG: DUF58 domain-containing protein [Gammaproteobacteria bacterium]
MTVKSSKMAELLQYRLPWPSSSVYPGAHLGQITGTGQLFKQFQPLMASPDPRRIDLRASVLDPFDSYRVRVYQQLSAISVYVIADLSASMGYGLKQQSLARFLLNAAHSAALYRDSFGFIGGHDDIEQRWLLPAGQNLSRIEFIASDLATKRLQGRAKGLLKAPAYLPARKSLVFIVSDFYWPLDDLRRLLGALQAHDVVPLVLWDSHEYDRLPVWGMVGFQDMERGRRRALFMRPSLHWKIVAAYEKRRNMLSGLFRSFGNEPVFLEGCDIPLINRHLQQRAA